MNTSISSNLIIEGAETQVLLDCADLLTNVDSLFVEYHSFEREDQSLDTLLRVLKDAGFRTYVQTAFCPPQPFIATHAHLDMDLQLNIFGVRAKE